MADWDTSKPGDTDVISQYPANERTQRAAVETIFGVEHHEENDANQGLHEAATMIARASKPTTGASKGSFYSKVVDGITEGFYVDSDGNEIQFTDGGVSLVGKTEIITPDNPTGHTAKYSENAGIVLFDSASDCTLTLPEQGSEVIPAGFFILVVNIGGGNVSIALEGTDTLDGVPLLQTPSQLATIFLQDDTDPNVWGICGNDWIPEYIEDDTLTAPPGTTPDLGDVYILAGDGTGAWAGGVAGDFAIHLGSDVYHILTDPFAATSSGWVYRVPKNGFDELYYISPAATRIRITREGKLRNPDIIRMANQAAPSDEAGVSNIYSKDKSAVATPYARDESGNEQALIGLVSESEFNGAGQQDLVTNGYQYLAGGLLFQWGSGTATANDLAKSFAFNQTFPNACLQLVISGEINDALQTGNVGNSTTPFTTTTGYVANADNVNHVFRWFAIGY